jgi:bifunctional DNase/RNase
LCERHAALLWDSYLDDDRIGEGLDAKIEKTGSFEPELIMIYEREQVHRVLLREVGHKRLLILPVLYLECCVLCYAVLESPYKDLALHVAMAKVIEHCGGKLTYVILDEVHSQGYFIAKAVFLHNENAVEIRIRPSDGVALAVFTNIPFVAAENVILHVAKTHNLNGA